jgi:tRNA (cmo5U34)-methyltransferase
VLEIVADTAAAKLTTGGRLLDIGCGAGNFTLSVLGRISPLDCTLVDLSRPMLDRAAQRVSGATSGDVTTIQSDMRTLDFPEGSFDTILAGAVLHHLRDDADWDAMFRLLFRWLRPGGMLFVADLVTFDDATIHAVMWRRYGDYLTKLGGEEYCQKVMAYIEKEDSPRSLAYQLGLAQRVGFSEADVLHRNSVFATYYARKTAL